MKEGFFFQASIYFLFIYITYVFSFLEIWWYAAIRVQEVQCWPSNHIIWSSLQSPSKSIWCQKVSIPSLFFLWRTAISRCPLQVLMSTSVHLTTMIMSVKLRWSEWVETCIRLIDDSECLSEVHVLIAKIRSLNSVIHTHSWTDWHWFIGISYNTYF